MFFFIIGPGSNGRSHKLKAFK